MWTIRRKPKVPQLQQRPVLVTHDILRLDVAMVNSSSVTVLQAVDELTHGVFDDSILTHEGASLRQELEEVAACAVVEDNEDVAVFFDDSVQGEDAGVWRDRGVETNLAFLEGRLTTTGLGFEHALDGKVRRGEEVEGSEDDSAGAVTKRFYETESTIVDDLANELVNARNDVRHRGAGVRFGGEVGELTVKSRLGSNTCGNTAC